MLKYVDNLSHHNCVWRTNIIYLSKIQENTVTNIEGIGQDAFSHAIVMFIGVSSDSKFKKALRIKQGRYVPPILVYVVLQVSTYMRLHLDDNIRTQIDQLRR